MKQLLRYRSPIFFLLVGLTIVAAFLRLWNFSDTLMFQGDQGRDALIVSRIFTHHDPVFIGPVTSVGNMYLGPLYYYFMLPFLYLSYPSPLGPALAVAVLGIVTVPLLYLLGKEMIGRRAALIAAIMGTFSVSAVVYSRFSWNPNPAPLVGLIMVWATYRAWKRSAWYWVVVAVCFSILIQLHYIAALSLGGAGLIWLISLWQMLRKPTAQRNKDVARLAMVTLLSIGVTLLSFTPLVLFDYRHDGLIRNALLKLFTEEKILDKTQAISLPAKIAGLLKDTHGRAMHILFEHMIGKNRVLNTFLLVLVAAITALQFKRPRWVAPPGLIVVVLYLLTGIFGTALYQHSLFEHYFAYLFPVVFFTLGVTLSWISRQKSPIGTLVAGSALICFIIVNVSQLPLQSQAWTITDVDRTTKTIYEHLKPGEPYSLVLLSPSKDLYAQNYRYFLSTTDRPPLPPELAGQAQALVVINEEHVSDVASLPIYEIVTFANKNISEEYTVPNGPEIIIFR